MSSAAESVIAELECALNRAPAAWRNTILRRVTDLFLVDAEAYTGDQVEVFDDVISLLINGIDRRALAELASRLAPVKNAPVNVVGTLARHADITVAGPLLEKSNTLTDQDLVEIAEKDRRDPNFFSMIVTRTQLSEALTDILIRRGSRVIQRKVIDNPGARISEASFARLVTSVENDKEFAAAIAQRADLPAELRPWLDAVLA